MTRISRLAVPALAAASLTLAGCSAFSDEAPATGPADDNADAGSGTAEVVASFYPLQFITEQVGGERVSVSPLTPPGVDPHNLELAPRTVVDMGSAGMVVYLSGFQPAVDEAVATTGARAFDAADHTELLVAGEDQHHDHDHAMESALSTESALSAPDVVVDHAGHDHGEDDGEDDGAHHGHSHGPEDPHFWLDPLRLADVATALAAELTEVDPDGAADYTENAEALAQELRAVHEEYTEGLARCEQRTIVAAHEAYGYLAANYDLEQQGLSGIDPDTEPSPARIAEIADVVEAEGVTTIFAETLLNPTVSQTLAEDLGVDVAVLDPLENQQDPGADYLDVMRTNLGALRAGLGCE